MKNELDRCDVGALSVLMWSSSLFSILLVALTIFRVSNFHQPVRLVGSYCCWFIYMKEKYYWLIQMNSIFVRGLASLAPASQPSHRAEYQQHAYGTPGLFWK